MEGELSGERIAELAGAEEILLTVTDAGFGKRSSAYHYRVTGRGGQGITNITLGGRNGGAVAAAFPVRPGDGVMLVTDAGQLIRVPSDQIRVTGRASMGVMLLRVADGERVTSVFPVLDETPDVPDAEIVAEAVIVPDEPEDGTDPDMPEPGMSEPRRLVGMYPGTFDPVTNGHIDIIGRAARLVHRLVVGVAANIGKSPLFPMEERVELVRAETDAIAARTGTEIEVVSFSGLLIDFAHEVHAGVIIRGLRAVSDFDYEFQMAGMNARLATDVETVFLMASEHHQFISSRFVKEIATLGGDVSSFVPPLTLNRTLARVRKT